MTEEQIEPISSESPIDDKVVDESVATGKLPEEQSEHINKDDPASVKKRLGMQAKKHSREIRALNERIAEMQNMMHQISSANSGPSPAQFNSTGQPNTVPSNEEERIHHAVRMALGMKADEERQAHHAAMQAHVQNQYKRLHDDFNSASDRYDDFDDVVMQDNSLPFTHSMKDAMLLIDNAPDVAYRLAKNKSELERISKLHPLEQAREVTKLSFSLMNGSNGKSKPSTNKGEPLNVMRGNPGSTDQAITERTSPAAIRERMKKGTWK